jgi:hypothetical protein
MSWISRWSLDRRFAQSETGLEVGVLVARIDGSGCCFHSQKDVRGDEEEDRSQECFETGSQLLLMSVVERVLIRHDKLYWVELCEFAAVTSTLISRLRSKKRRPPRLQLSSAEGALRSIQIWAPVFRKQFGMCFSNHSRYRAIKYEV